MRIPIFLLLDLVIFFVSCGIGNQGNLFSAKVELPDSASLDL